MVYEEGFSHSRSMNYFRRSIATGILLLVLHPSFHAQSPYTLRWSTDLGLSGFGLATASTGWILGKKINPLQPADLARLNRNDVFPINRNATFMFSGKANRASDIVLYAATAAPLLFLADKRTETSSGVIAGLYLETLTISGGLTVLTKNLSRQTRPYAYNPQVPLPLKLRRDTRKSFFSGHTSSTAASCFFAAKVWSDYHPGSRWKPLVWTAAAGIPACTGLLRIRAGRHFFTDVLTGYAVGATIGCLIPYLHYNSK